MEYLILVQVQDRIEHNALMEFDCIWKENERYVGPTLFPHVFFISYQKPSFASAFKFIILMCVCVTCFVIFVFVFIYLLLTHVFLPSPVL